MKMKEKERSIAPVSNQDATIHSVTRRRFLETSVIAGAGTLLGTAPFARAWQAPLVNASFYKGMCYQPMPFYRDPVRGVQPYSPSIANTTKIFFGSDIAYNCMEPLWGTSFTSRSGTTYPRGRNDVEKLQNMGVNLVRWSELLQQSQRVGRCQHVARPGVEVLGADGEGLAEIRDPGPFDGIYSNFGAFNCIADPGAVSGELARLLRPGGKLVMCLLGRFCLWETAWFVLHGGMRKGFRRFSGMAEGSVASPGSSPPFKARISHSGPEGRG